MNRDAWQQVNMDCHILFPPRLEGEEVVFVFEVDTGNRGEGEVHVERRISLLAMPAALKGATPAQIYQHWLICPMCREELKRVASKLAIELCTDIGTNYFGRGPASTMVNGKRAGGAG